MALTIKGIEAAKPKIDRTSGKARLVRLSDGNGLFLEVTETSKRWRARYFFAGSKAPMTARKRASSSTLSARSAAGALMK